MAQQPGGAPPETAGEAAPPRPTTSEGLFEFLPGSIRGQSLLLVGIFSLMSLYTLHFARDVIVPIVLAIMLNLLLSPLVSRMKRLLRIPEWLGAAAVVVGFVALVGFAGYALSGPAMEWFEKAPESARLLREKLAELAEPVRRVQEATEEVGDIADGGAGRAAAPPAVTVREGPGLGEYFVIGTTALLAQVVVVLILGYFLLASGDLFMRRFVKALDSTEEKRRAVEITRSVQRDLTTYLGTVTLINAGLGAAVAGAMWALGMPNPVLWGVAAGVLNFIPYFGSLLMVVVLTVVALLTYDDLGHALLAPGIFFLLTSIEANLVTPLLLGRRLMLNPAIVFVSLVLWAWLWGVPGGFLAVPFLVMAKSLADRVEALSAISIFLGRRAS